MTRRRALLILGGLWAGLSPSTLHAQKPPRLIADNRTGYLVDIHAFNGQTWNFVMRLNPRSWTAFPNAQSGSLWRATIGQVTRDHRVHYVWDPNYGGYQSVWWIQ